MAVTTSNDRSSHNALRVDETYGICCFMVDFLYKCET